MKVRHSQGGRPGIEPGARAVAPASGPVHPEQPSDAQPVTRVSTRELSDGMTDQPKPCARSPRSRFRWVVPVRLRIMSWLVLLLFIALFTVVVVTRNLLVAEAETAATEALSQETSEFLQAAQRGVDPISQRRFVDGRDLLLNHVQRQYTDDDEILLGVTAQGEILPQPGREPIALASRDNRLDPILRATERTGLLDTRDGRLRWSKVPIFTDDGIADGTFVVAYAIDRRIAEIDEVLRLLALVSLAGLVLAAGAAWIVSGQILEPVNQVRRTAAEISHHDLTRRIPVHGNDDLAALSDQFNAMLDRLEQAFGAQRQFLDDAGHELRTPITIIRGNLETVEEDDDPDERAEVVRLCLDELDRMSRIVEDLLLLAKARRTDFIQCAPAELVDLTLDIDAKIRALGTRRWHLESIAEGEAVLDAQRITQAVVQLAQNAVQHTKVGDDIALGSRADRPGIAFWIRDSGPGVQPDEARSIFRRFSRGTGGGSRTHRTGAGLGLSIVTAIAESHNGWVELESVPGHGATFTVRIPTSEDHQPAPDARTAEGIPE
ncbi:MAG: sensor histidine kinase [Pseudonocardia sp.]